MVGGSAGGTGGDGFFSGEYRTRRTSYVLLLRILVTNSGF